MKRSEEEEKIEYKKQEGANKGSGEREENDKLGRWESNKEN